MVHQAGTTSPITSWVLSDKEQRFKFTLNYSFLAVEDLHYTSLDEYLARTDLVIRSFSAAYEKPQYTRIGLRYINTINLDDGEPLVWSEYISDSLTCPLDHFEGKREQLSRFMGQYVLNSDEYQIIWNYGIFNPEFPGRIARRQFILDYDCYSQDVSADIPAQVRKFNLAILELFETSIKEPLRKLMGGSNATEN